MNERLERLDQEMTPRGGKQHDALMFTRDGRKYPVTVLKIADFRYAATTSTQHPAKNIVLRAYAKTPSGAVKEVLTQLKWNLKQSPEAVKRLFPQMA